MAAKRKGTIGGPGGRQTERVSLGGHFTSGGNEDRIDSTFPPVRRPKIVPRSYRRLNST